MNQKEEKSGGKKNDASPIFPRLLEFNFTGIDDIDIETGCRVNAELALRCIAVPDLRKLFNLQ
jgi:hypothetical protein